MSSSTSSAHAPDNLPFPDVTLRMISAGMLPAELEDVIELWRSLQKTSVDAASAPNSSIFEFQERCLSLQSIYATIEKDKDKKQAKQSPIAVDFPEYRIISGFDGRQNCAGPSALASDIPNYYSSMPVHDAYDTMMSTGSVDALADYNMETLPEYMTIEDNPFLTSPTTLPLQIATNTHVTRPLPVPLSSTGPRPDSEEAESNSPVLVGIIYLALSTHFDREALIGIALKPDARGKGIGAAALHQVLECAFDTWDFHRVSAGIISAQATRGPALRMFVAAGFAVEGMRRRAVLVQGDAGEEWQDVQFLGMLDTEWVVRSIGKTNAARVRRRTRWDEMIKRHEHEQVELLADEECGRPLKRTASSETLRARNSGAQAGVREVIADSGLESGTGTDTESEASLRSRRNSPPRVRTDSIDSFGNYRTQAQDPFADDASRQSSDPPVLTNARVISQLAEQQQQRLGGRPVRSNSASGIWSPNTVSDGNGLSDVHRYRSPFPASGPSISSASTTSSRIAFLPNDGHGPFSDALEVAQSLPDTGTSASSQYESAATDSEMFDETQVGGAHMHVHIGAGVPAFGRGVAEEPSDAQVDEAEAVHNGDAAIQLSSAMRIGTWRERVAAATATATVTVTAMPSRTGVPVVPGPMRAELEEVDDRDGEVCIMDNQAYASLPISRDMTLCMPIQVPAEDQVDIEHEDVNENANDTQTGDETNGGVQNDFNNDDNSTSTSTSTSTTTSTDTDTDSDAGYEEKFRARVGLLSGAVSPSRSDDVINSNPNPDPDNVVAQIPSSSAQAQVHRDRNAIPPPSSSSASAPQSPPPPTPPTNDSRASDSGHDASNQTSENEHENESATWDIVSISDAGVPSSVSVSSVSMSLQSASDGEL